MKKATLPTLFLPYHNMCLLWNLRMYAPLPLIPSNIQSDALPAELHHNTLVQRYWDCPWHGKMHCGCHLGCKTRDRRGLQKPREPRNTTHKMYHVHTAPGSSRPSSGIQQPQAVCFVPRNQTPRCAVPLLWNLTMYSAKNSPNESKNNSG